MKQHFCNQLINWLSASDEIVRAFLPIILHLFGLLDFTALPARHLAIFCKQQRSVLIQFKFSSLNAMKNLNYGGIQVTNSLSTISCENGSRQSAQLTTFPSALTGSIERIRQTGWHRLSHLLQITPCKNISNKRHIIYSVQRIWMKKNDSKRESRNFKLSSALTLGRKILGFSRIF